MALEQTAIVAGIPNHSSLSAACFFQLQTEPWKGWFYGPSGLHASDFVESGAPAEISRAHWRTLKVEVTPAHKSRIKLSRRTPARNFFFSRRAPPFARWDI
jgi:hypothetical protein